MDSHNVTDSAEFTPNPIFEFINKMLAQCLLKNTTIVTSTDNPDQKDVGLHCPRTFDGFACWDDTPAGTTVYQRCPHFIVGFDPRRFAFKRCKEDGTWYRHLETNKSWTNYTTCVNMEDLEFRKLVNNIYIIGYTFSIIALLASVALFNGFKTLICTRTRVHTHLFIALSINNMLWIIWYLFVVNDTDTVFKNSEWCKYLHMVTNYFMTCCYMWMFCESLIIYFALVSVFVEDSSLLNYFKFIGWGFSMILSVIYAAVRWNLTEDVDQCWVNWSNAMWVIVIPVGISMTSSFVFLVTVIRIILTKLRLAPNQHGLVAVRKAARATIILIPLFGLHFVLIPIRPSTDSTVEKVYEIISALLASLQGLCISILFCFTNTDVINAVKAKIARRRRENEAIALSGIRRNTPAGSTANNQNMDSMV